MTRPRLPQSRGMTLMEVVVSLTIISILLLGLGSTLVVASKAMPAGPAQTVMQSTAAVERISSELPYAVAVNQRSAHAVEFTVADRNGDGTAETIRYEWSGVAGDPLNRRYNGGTAVSILDAVGAFDLTYRLNSVSTVVPQSSEGAEALLKSFQTVVHSNDYSVQSAAWYGQYFKPTLPADTVSWRLTRVEFYAKIAGYPTGSCRVQIQSATAGNLPSGVVLSEKTLWESTLGYDYLKQPLTFDVSGLTPGQGLCLVFRWASGNESCKIEGDASLGSPLTDSALVKSVDSGATWTSYTGQSLWYAVYGKATSPTQPLTQQTLYLTSVDVTARASGDSADRATTEVRLLNQPQVQP